MLDAEKKQSHKRRAFTKGWNESFEMMDSLPIKQGGKVIKTFIPTPKPSKGKDEEENILIHDDSEDEAKRQQKQEDFDQKKAQMILARSRKTPISLEIDMNIVNSERQKISLQEKVANLCTLILANPEEGFSHRKKKVSSSEDGDSQEEEEEEAEDVREKRHHGKKEKISSEAHIEDLLKLTSSLNPYEVEITLLSTAVLFKDICPSYRIRHVKTESDNSQISMNQNTVGNPMKKETRKLLQYEKLLVKYYHDFLLILQKRIEWAFNLQNPSSRTQLSIAAGGQQMEGEDEVTQNNNNNNKVAAWKKYEKIRKYLGYIAYQAEAELFKSLYAFNYRSVLLSSLFQQSMTFYDYYYKYLLKTTVSSNQSIASFTTNFTANMIHQIMATCIESLEYVILHDHDKDTTLEIVTTFYNCLKMVKYNISSSLLQILKKISFQVHLNEKTKISKLKKVNKKNVKSQIDSINREVEIGLLEANANGNIINKKSFEIQILQETCLIYFRILKMKIGYHLLPVALEGLSRITHLIDMETVKDLIILLRAFLFQQTTQMTSSNTLMNTSTPYEVKLLSLHCILKTLVAYSGKDILQVDDEPYLLMFKLLIKKFPDPTTLPAVTSLVGGGGGGGSNEEGSTFAEDAEIHHPQKNQTMQYSIKYYWKITLQIIDILLVQKHEERNAYVISILRVLLGQLCFQINQKNLPSSIGVPVLTYIHNTILRYPRIRSDLQEMIRKSAERSAAEGREEGSGKSEKRNKKQKKQSPQLFIEDDTVVDLAMKGLQEYDFHQNSLLRYRDDTEDVLKDSIYRLLQHSKEFDRRYSQIVEQMCAKDFHPLPFRWEDLEDEVKEKEAIITAAISSNQGGNRNQKRKRGQAKGNFVQQKRAKK